VATTTATAPGYNVSTSFTGTVTATGSTSVTIQPPLQISSGQFQYQTNQSIVLTFNRAIDPTMLASAMTLTNVTKNATLASGAMHVAYSNNTATITFASVLPDANYSLSIPASAPLNSSGDHLSSNYTLNFFVETGDADHNGVVNTTDFTMLAQNFGAAPATFGQGDFNYDGKVNALDFNALASNFGAPAPGVHASGTLQEP